MCGKLCYKLHFGNGIWILAILIQDIQKNFFLVFFIYYILLPIQSEIQINRKQVIIKRILWNCSNDIVKMFIPSSPSLRNVLQASTETLKGCSSGSVSLVTVTVTLMSVWMALVYVRWVHLTKSYINHITDLNMGNILLFQIPLGIVKCQTSWKTKS